VQVTRTRDKDKIADAVSSSTDFVVDVGGIYDRSYNN